MSPIENEIATNEELFFEIEAKVSQIKISDSDLKSMLFAAFLQDALSHFISINILIEKKLFNTAFALVRIFFDTIIRALYAVYILDTGTFNKMYTNTIDWDFPKTKVMCSELDKYFGEDIFEKIRTNSYGTMCDYTHIGKTQIARHFDEPNDLIKPHFDDSLIVDTLKGNYVLMELLAKNFIAYIQSNGLCSNKEC